MVDCRPSGSYMETPLPCSRAAGCRASARSPGQSPSCTLRLTTCRRSSATPRFGVLMGFPRRGLVFDCGPSGSDRDLNPVSSKRGLVGMRVSTSSVAVIVLCCNAVTATELVVTLMPTSPLFDGTGSRFRSLPEDLRFRNQPPMGN